jgi:nicotinamide riboside transporter PnuC
MSLNVNLIGSFVLGALGIWGIVLAGRHSRFGWLLGLFAQVLWFIFGIVTKQYGFLITAVAYGVVYARNYYKWSLQHDDEAKRADSNIDQ